MLESRGTQWRCMAGPVVRMNDEGWSVSLASKRKMEAESSLPVNSGREESPG